ncbi:MULTISPECIES: cell division FtsA domain-containing protein [Clostridium]|uniref:cell division FtsA domain-containing protein n=1 Tax=Clostridium TaxID=1485 RepID=UPI0005C12EF9|nr:MULTISPECIES: cell division FtsA domain-containing protein [Clostridium]AXB84237.1 cell division protein FtsA [Clostridium butyricum]KIU07145.1 cell division protein FtsA [Clostridium butyricum]KJZ83084.1 Cell division protein FtsA [Clostridium sp. IBUN125C]KJZ84582.1 putative alkaline-shock protein [Clostridium sp. IBUN13A]KJZ88101.1 Cell division protein FtsA [Clostridium sp. IBUN22A]
MLQEIITAIDIGSKKLSATIGVKNKSNELEILLTKSCKSVGIEKGTIVDINKCREAIEKLLKELEETTERNIKNVTVGISSRKIRITEITVKVDVKDGKITQESLMEGLDKAKREFLLSEEEIIIDEIINFYIINNQVVYKDIINWKADSFEMNLTLVIANKSEIDKYNEIFKNTKYKIDSIKSNIITGRQIFLSENKYDGEYALVDVGAGVVDISVFDDNAVIKNISSIPVGGNNISNDLAICGKFSFLEADNIKKIYSSNYKTLYKDKSVSNEIKVGTVNVPKELFFEVTNARIEEILNHIHMELKKSGHYDRICSIILYGDALSYFEDIAEIVSKIFKKKIKIIKDIDLGIKNSENITSLALVKEVYDRLILLGDNKIIPNNKKSEKENVNEDTEILHNNEDENHILNKLKSFFNKIF